MSFLATASLLIVSALCQGYTAAHTYVGQSFPPPQPVPLSTWLVPTPLTPNHLVTVTSELGFATLADTAVARLPGGHRPVLVKNVGDVASAGACNQLCLQARNSSLPESRRQCSLWQYCTDVPGGCPSANAQLSLGARTCQLQSVPSLEPGFSLPPCTEAVCTAAPANHSLVGAPILVDYTQSPSLPGYARYPCVGAAERSDFTSGCPPATNLTKYRLAANPGPSCWVNGTLADIAAACSDTPECDFLVYYPLGRSLGSEPARVPSGLLKTARSSTNASRLSPDVGELLQPEDYDQRKSFNPLAVAYYKYQTLLEASSIKPSALNASQLVAVIEVKNVTGDPAQAGADLRIDLHAHLQPPPRRVRLGEAAASHSRVSMHAAAKVASPRPPAPGAARSAPVPAALVVVNMTFESPEDASAAEAALNISLAKLGAPGRAVALLYVTGHQELPESNPAST